MVRELTIAGRRGNKCLAERWHNTAKKTSRIRRRKENKAKTNTNKSSSDRKLVM